MPSSSFCLSLLLIFSLYTLSHSTDTLIPGQSIKESDNSTLISENGVFELGFFSPVNSTNRYIGIWYHNLSPQSIVWIANREIPILPSVPTALQLSHEGNLEIVVVGGSNSGGNTTIWSTNITFDSSNDLNTSMVQLLDTGNLEFRSGNDTILWQSFDYPTDTFLPGMCVGFNYSNGIRQLYTSWRAPDDPAPGNFTLGLDPNGSTQIFIWKDGSIPYWRSGEWNGASNFMGIPWRPLYSVGFKFTNDTVKGDEYYTYKAANNSLQRFVVQWNGTEDIYLYDNSTNQWEKFWSQPVKQCEFYGTCGPNGLCSNGNADMAVCDCLKGFQPGSDAQWKAGNWTDGCVRKVQLGCTTNQGGDGYIKYSYMKLPDKTERYQNIGDGDSCANFCSNECSCNAYAFVSTVGCMIWTGDMMDVYDFGDPDSGYDLYVKVPSSFLGSKSKVTIAAVAASVSIVLFLAVCILLWRKYKKKTENWFSKSSTTSLKSSIAFRLGLRPDFSGPRSQFGDESEDGKNFELPLFTFECIATATNNFGVSNKLGEGGFGLVYKGMLPTGEEIAVKRLSKTSGQGIEEFKNEVILIAKLQHRNLVRLLGYCIQGEEKILVYEYLPNKSLDAFLFDPTKRSLLDWKVRFNIIEGIARGLLYLHRDSRLRVVHRDLKASNILLDKDMEPKISDFGMARIFGSDQNQENTTRVVGTFGYMSPEYAMEGLFSVKSDVYSFGILLLEIITGEKNSSFHLKENSLNIVGYAWKLWNDNKATELIDPTIRETCATNEVLRCIHVALLCVQDLANERPEIPLVIKMISSESSNIPLPKRPTFTLQSSSFESERNRNWDESLSNCDVTITTVQGR